MRRSTRRFMQLIVAVLALPIIYKLWSGYGENTKSYPSRYQFVAQMAQEEKFQDLDKNVKSDKPKDNANIKSGSETIKETEKESVGYNILENITKRKGETLEDEPSLQNIVESTGTCDVNKCNPVKDGMLNVHVIAHTHDDVGWLKTMDQYYSGKGGGNSKSNYYGGECVECILNSAIPALMKNPNRRFIYVEMSFFSKWFYKQPKETQENVKKLIKERRLEFIVGGWCMSDAATTYYNDIIDQHTIGFDFILKEFGKCALPKVGWHIDQFGHSREHSSLFAQMGFDALFLGRIDDQDHEYRIKNRNMETLWRASPKNLGDKASLFTSVLYDFYFAPSGLSFEGYPASFVQGAQARSLAQRFINVAKERSQGFKHNHVLIPFGGDFAFRSAEGYLGTLEKIIEAVNAMQAEGSKVNALFSTPTCYVNYVNKAGVKFQPKEDDFFPYSIIPASHWTGYFVSRSGLKLHVKHASSLLQTCKEISSLAGLVGTYNKTQILREAVAVLQHHDAITGTEKQHVTDDYNQMLSKGETACQSVISASYEHIMLKPDTNVDKSNHLFCPELNMTQCAVTEELTKAILVAFNPLSHEVTTWMRLPVAKSNIRVLDYTGAEVKTQMIPISSETKRIPERKSSTAESEVVFKAVVPPLGYTSFFLDTSTVTSPDVTPISQDSSQSGELTISNQHVSFTIDRSTGKISSVQNAESGISAKVDQEYMYYIGDVGQPRNPQVHTLYGNHRRASGAYTFVPKLNTKAEPVRGTQPVKYKVVKGQNVQEIHQQFNGWTSQVIRLYDNAKYLEFEWTVGPIDVDDGQGREIVSHFATDLDTKALFYTDSNGREMVERRRDFRATWPLNVTDKISGNYYPITNKIFIKDTEKNIQLTVLNDRSQGGGSIQDGALEIMVHRRLLHDDDLGVQEPLNEKGIDGNGIIYRGKHYMFLEKVSSMNSEYRHMGLQIHQPPTISFVKTSGDEKFWLNNYNTKWSGLREPMPQNINILTLDQMNDRGNYKLLIRLENIYEVNENSLLSKKATINLQRLFVPFDIQEVYEVSLGASLKISDVERLKWTTEDGRISPLKIGSSTSRDKLEAPFTVDLEPMEIRTFRVSVGQQTHTAKSLFNIF